MKITNGDVADLVEYAVNETKPKIKTKRGVGSEFEIKVGRQKFVVVVTKQKRAKKRAA